MLPGIVVNAGVWVPRVVAGGGGGGSFTPTLGTKAPSLGAGAQSPFPAAGWSTNVSASADDANFNLTFPFNFIFNNTTYTSAWPASNDYITFGAGSIQFTGLSAANPPNDKIMITAGDHSWQRVSSITDSVSSRWVRYRFEGTSTTSGTPGSPTQVYEVTFFSSTFTGGFPVVEILMGVRQNGTFLSGIYSSTALLTGGTMASNTGLAANQSYVLVGNATGTSWTVYTGYYVGGTSY